MLEKIIKKLPGNDLTAISITKSNYQKFRWVEKNKEFRFDGKLYDLVRIHKEGDTTFICCINDKQEEKLQTNLDNHLQKETDILLPQNKKIQTTQGKIIKDYVVYNCSFLILSSSKKILYYSNHEKLIPFYPDIITPPPKNLL